MNAKTKKKVNKKHNGKNVDIEELKRLEMECSQYGEIKTTKPSNRMRPRNVVELKKNYNWKDASIVNVKDPHFFRKPSDKNSCYYGFTPIDIYENTNHALNYNDIYVVKKYSPEKLNNAYKIAINKSNELSKMAANEYRKDLDRIEILKQKNLIIARINSLRLLNKAVLIEKRYYETKFEMERHKTVLSDINKLKPSLLEQNDIDLRESIARLSLDREVELSNNIIDRNKALARIQEKKEIIEIKRKWRVERVKTLSAGKPFNIKLDKNQFEDVRKKYETFNSNEDLFVKDVNTISSIFANMDKSKLSSAERNVVNKFLKLKASDTNFARKIDEINRFSKENELHREKIRNYRERLQTNIKDRKYMIISSEAYQRVINAKKEQFMIVEDAVKFTNDYRELNSIYSQFDYDENLDFEDIYTKKEIESSIDKWKRIEKAIEKNDNYRITKLDDKSYKIDFIENIDEDSAITQRNKGGRRIACYLPGKIRKMREDFGKLINSQLVIDNMNVFEMNNLYLPELYEQFKKADVERFERSPENIEFVKTIGLCFSLYHQLIDEEIQSRRRIKQAQKLDSKYTKIADDENQKLTELTISVDRIFKHKNAKVNRKYDEAIEQIKNQHFIAKEEIVENYHSSIAKEEEAHLSNVAFYNKHLKKIESSQLKYEISQINMLLRKIDAYNQRVPENQIDKFDIPCKVNPIALDSENVKITMKKGPNNSIIGVSSPNESTVLVGKAINKTIPHEGFRKIVVLDKFRDVDDQLQRVAMLRELALVNYESDIRKAEELENEQIEEAKNKLMDSMALVEKIRSDAEFMYDRAVFMSSESKKMTALEKNLHRLKKENWKQSKIDEKISKSDEKKEKNAEEKAKKRELRLMPIQTGANLDNLGKVTKASKPTKVVTKKISRKSNKKNASSKKSSAKNELVVKKSTEKKSSGSSKKTTSTKMSLKAKKPKRKMMSKLSNILSFSKGYDEIDLDEIIGKKSR